MAADGARAGRRTLLLGGGAAALGLAALGGAALLTGRDGAPGGARVLGWSDLMPEGEAAQGVIGHGAISSVAEWGPSGWVQPEGPVVEALDGALVRLAGFVVPLAFDEAARVTRFLLVPFVGACIHVPPPPTNQIVLVEAAEGFASRSLFHPVEVTGRLTTTEARTGLAAAGYHLAADAVRDHRG